MGGTHRARRGHRLDPAMTTNVLQSLSINDETAQDITDRRLDYLIKQIEPECAARWNRSATTRR